LSDGAAAGQVEAVQDGLGTGVLAQQAAHVTGSAVLEQGVDELDDMAAGAQVLNGLQAGVPRPAEAGQE